MLSVMKTHAQQSHKPLHLFFVVTILMGFYYPCNSQSGFPFAFGDQVIYYPKLYSKTQNIEAIKAGLTQSLKRVGQIYDIAEKKTITAKEIKNITVFNDRIELEVKGKKNNFVWLFSVIDDSTMFFIGKQNAGNYIYLPSTANFAFAELDAAQQFADNIYAIQYPNINKLRDSLLAIFKEKMQAFKASKKEAAIKDEQKALFLLADTAIQKMDYFNAIKIYNKAIEIDEMAYPLAYANTALLYAQINFFDYAVMYMQKYIWLETNETALRGAKDKMYEWEGLIYY
jgi:tetratricopeptide (TPR) repeat protein